jgi:hypothetical protein
MLNLKRNGRFNELYKCDISGEFIPPGEYYYEDDDDGFIVKADVYRKLKDEKIKKEFNYDKLNQAQSGMQYANLLRQAEKQYLTATIFDRVLTSTLLTGREDE